MPPQNKFGSEGQTFRVLESRKNGISTNAYGNSDFHTFGIEYKQEKGSHWPATDRKEGVWFGDYRVWTGTAEHETRIC